MQPSNEELKDIVKSIMLFEHDKLYGTAYKKEYG